MRITVWSALCALTFLSACTPSEANNAALDNSTERVASCDTSEMSKAADGINVLSWREEASICAVASSSLGQMPETGVLRMLLKTAFLIGHENGSSARDEAYQMMNVVEARGLTAPDRVKSTLDLAYRVNLVTIGHVTPRDLNVFLRSSGDMAKTLSDEGLTNMASVVWEMKKQNGE